MISSEFPPGPGGIGTHAYQLAVHLQTLQWDLTTVSPQDYAEEQEIDAFNRSCPFPIERLHPVSPTLREAMYRWRVVSRRVAIDTPDCLFASGSRAVWLSALMARWRRLPWLAVAHGTELHAAGWQAPLTRWAFKQANAVVCVSHYTCRQMVLAGIQPRRQQVIPNGADEKRFQRLPAEEVAAYRVGLGLGHAQLLLTVGNVSERKGQDVVIRALPSILAQAPDTHYLIAGLPTRRPTLEALAQELGVLDHVHFLGRVANQELPLLMNACDLFVMTSRHTAGGDFEGYGIAVVEAALCGLPAIVSAPSGLAEAIVDGETGIAVPQDDPEATAHAIIKLLQNGALCQQIGEAARRRALHEQTWAQRATAYDALLRELVAQPALR